MKNVLDMSRKELVAAAKEIGFTKAHTMKSETLIEELTMYRKSQEEKAAPNAETKDETDGAVVVLREWVREDGKWVDKGLATKMYKGMTKTEIVNQYRENNTRDASKWETPLAVFTKKDYGKFMDGKTASKAHKGFTKEFVREEVGNHFA